MPAKDGAQIGRPRCGDIDAVINDSVLEVIAEVGYLNLTFVMISERSGVSRPTIYRRASNKVSLVVGALVSKYGLDPIPDTGEVLEDLLALQRSQLLLYSDPAFEASLPGVIADIRSDRDALESWLDGFVRPRRIRVAEAIQRGVQRGELTADVDEEWVCEILTGPLISSAFLRGSRRLPDKIALETVKLVLGRYRPE